MTDKPTTAERAASSLPGCTCSAHCEHVHGDQAATAEERQIDRLKHSLAVLHRYIDDAKIACGEDRWSGQPLAEVIVELRKSAAESERLKQLTLHWAGEAERVTKALAVATDRRVRDLESICSRLQEQIQEAAAIEREAIAQSLFRWPDLALLIRARGVK